MLRLASCSGAARDWVSTVSGAAADDSRMEEGGLSSECLALATASVVDGWGFGLKSFFFETAAGWAWESALNRRGRPLRPPQQRGEQLTGLTVRLAGVVVVVASVWGTSSVAEAGFSTRLGVLIVSAGGDGGAGVGVAGETLPLTAGSAQAKSKVETSWLASTNSWLAPVPAACPDNPPAPMSIFGAGSLLIRPAT